MSAAPAPIDDVLVAPPGFVICATKTVVCQHLARAGRMRATWTAGRRGMSLCGRRVEDQDEIDWQRERAGLAQVHLTSLHVCVGCLRSHAAISDHELLLIADDAAVEDETTE